MYCASEIVTLAGRPALQEFGAIDRLSCRLLVRGDRGLMNLAEQAIAVVVEVESRREHRAARGVDRWP